MRRWRTTVGLAIVGAMLMGVPAASAVPDDSQRLRGLEGRTFQVSVTVTDSSLPNLPAGLVFDNCYTFADENVYVDPLFPAFDPANSVAGTWRQHRVGASTTYSAEASDDPVDFAQEGTVTPARGGGVLQLSAHAEVSLGELVLASFDSVGFENPTCLEDVFGGR